MTNTGSKMDTRMESMTNTGSKMDTRTESMTNTGSKMNTRTSHGFKGIWFYENDLK